MTPDKARPPKKTAKPTSRHVRRKKSKGYRIRKGRVASALLILIGLVLLCVWLVRGCSSSEEPEVVVDHVPVVEAAEAGRRDALKVLDTAPESMARQNVLLEIKARESKLRAEGYVHAADDYHRAAEKVLKDNGIIK